MPIVAVVTGDGDDDAAIRSNLIDSRDAQRRRPAEHFDGEFFPGSRPCWGFFMFWALSAPKQLLRP
jgi:hypothetical protein